MGAMGYLTKPVSLEQLNQAFVKIDHLINAKLKKLLVVEGDEDECDNIKGLLDDNDITIETVASGKETLHRLKNDIYHCIILGMNLSDMSGKI